VYAMDACEAVGIDVKAVFPEAVVAWKAGVR
jgi:hypothetical protein